MLLDPADIGSGNADPVCDLTLRLHLFVIQSITQDNDLFFPFVQYLRQFPVNLFHILMQFDLFKDIRLITLDNIQKRDLISLFIRSDRLIE